jgi:hypothetical protein
MPGTIGILRAVGVIVADSTSSFQHEEINMLNEAETDKALSQ